ncbi:UNVERIFIED_CONTAM: hypothetical protein FKN15_003426 [Acipenser sinensis]
MLSLFSSSDSILVNSQGAGFWWVDIISKLLTIEIHANMQEFTNRPKTAGKEVNTLIGNCDRLFET